MTREWVRYQHHPDHSRNREPWSTLWIALLSLILAVIFFS